MAGKKSSQPERFSPSGGSGWRRLTGVGLVLPVVLTMVAVALFMVMFASVVQLAGVEDVGNGVAAGGKYLLFLLLLAAGVSLLWRRRRRRNLATRVARRSPEYITRLSRRELLLLMSHYLEHRGFRVEKNPASGRDIDCIAVKGGETYYLRCLQGRWPAGGEEVRRLVHRVRADGVKGGMFVAASGFDDEAARRLKQEALTGINSGDLHHGMQEMQEQGGIRKRKPAAAVIGGAAVVLLVVAGSLAALLYTEPGREKAAWLTEQAGRYGLDFTLPAWAPLPEDTTREQGIFSGDTLRRTIEEMVQERKGGGDDEAGNEPPSYRYEIELHSGGWVHTDTIEIGSSTVTYTSKRGLEVAIERREIKTVKRIPVD